MKSSSTLIALTALCQSASTLAFAPTSTGERASRTRCEASRRDFLSTAVATAGIAASSVTLLTPLPGAAKGLGEGGLPDGAAQFSRVIKVKAQLKSVAKRVAEQPDDITKEEWDKIDDFLRTVYSAGNDMKVISKGIFDPSKKEKADEDIKLLQKVVQAAQKPVAQKDVKGFSAIAAKADGLFDDFLDQLRDVPDEL
mmetsp:Transcript_21009/g.26807  ORF Transcript_21009/g.26807 Transcript_21009/m.26807 type:complete len:197 (-) Transcript_21009:63-653(-)|eukprot:CAMPEP_0113415122 /NCGR_PEP_ID=MMETSP0013_2-20120614/24393_1 /TAXON_ID=2843 ORGANISM="Skeletonema costatum, Strain 1716" /NCGR_SAMPLE_ID=MMETSP0013_2 /ASSEMBLY_ACC=CAM_ASM_000158 /LENGTH=196 /DNA_ID=CAMNT_0000302047 /DNA_START=14 /DNA_END=604 /DNA_ORIENTATION=+ /assembly_acc=CAM_ASM_000158